MSITDRGLASCGHPANDDGECNCSYWPERAPFVPETRANRNGDPCPHWCVIDHDKLLVPGYKVFGYMNSHASDPMTDQLAPKAAVRLYLSGFAGQLGMVDVRHSVLPALLLAPDKAVALADLLESLTTRDDVEQLAAELRAAASVLAP